MSKLFDDGECDNNEKELKVNSNYANSYNKWRQKEELNKLKTKYGDHLKDIDSSEGSSDSSSSEDDEDGKELTEHFERDFFKTLSCLKKKDPKIYDNNVVFFQSTQKEEKAFDEEDESKSNEENNKKKKKKEKPLTLRDYERKMILEHDGVFSDSENESDFKKKSDEQYEKPLTYIEEQRELQESIKQVLKGDDDDDGFLKVKNKSNEEKMKEEESYKQWLAGQTDQINDEDKDELKYLRDFWSDPKLNKNEKFLRDYVLKKKFLEEENDGEEDLNEDYHHKLHDSDENLSEDEKNIDKQEEFEHKYNFRYEEPDAEFIKRYPRTMENSLRKKDTKRAQKRAEVKKRKEDEKLRIKEELKQLKALKRKEITDKIAQLKEITGNDDINLDIINFDSDFDPNEHDKKMQQIFNDEYYNNGEDNLKPEFPELDQELEIEKDWDSVDPATMKADENCDYNVGEPHCEDPDFIMDADYDPNDKGSLEKELVDNSRKKRKRKSKFSKLIAAEKPKFDPKKYPSFMEYFDQYYSLDYEDMIGDLPCRFKYRKVVPNDYGLTTEEILLADDKELNKWCSLKKALEHKPDNVELREVQTFKQKANNEAYKKKILPSLYKTNDKDEDQKDDAIKQESDETSNKKKRKKKKKKINQQEIKTEDVSESPIKVEDPNEDDTVNNKNNRKRKIEETNGNNLFEEKGKIDEAETSREDIRTEQPIVSDKKKKKTRKKQKNKNVQLENGKSGAPPTKKQKMVKNKNLNQSNNIDPGNKQDDLITSMSNKRLEAYGINPKKFKNKIKYGKKKS